MPIHVVSGLGFPIGHPASSVGKAARLCNGERRPKPSKCNDGTRKTHAHRCCWMVTARSLHPSAGCSGSAQTPAAKPLSSLIKMAPTVAGWDAGCSVVAWAPPSRTSLVMPPTAISGPSSHGLSLKQDNQGHDLCRLFEMCFSSMT